MNRILAVLFLFAVSLASAAEDKLTTQALAALAQQSEPLPVSLQFQQKKHLSGLPRVLVSSGQLDISKDEIIWTTEHPQQQQLRINRQGIFEQGSDTSISGSETVAMLLLAILQQDDVVLKRLFKLSLKQNCVVMTPKEEALGSVIEKIHSCGTDSVELVTLFEQSGNTTRIELSKR
ncbi:outer membrane lipoprotein carrier protein LolA [Idiomarina sp. HP20-50]|uniref:LolA family protein n=1 Tax=Idiomarina sp. HP20-50 TaxID=3070813 RepID=UPI00294B402D|nr:outer membrane lipoprotein carrier protein LolA [Idiomarina sp. HP20-50]MDV6316395.1 outer membrane lipoprotein carrier protein LolA [Idiomarina sp. HP20-50]